MGEKIKLDISIGSIIKVVLVIAAIYLIFLLREVILILFITAILIAAFYPVVNKWGKRIGKGWSVSVLIAIFIVAIFGFVYLLVPPLVYQSKQFLISFPDYLNYIRSIGILRDHLPSLDNAVGSVTNNFSSITGSFITATTTFIGGVAAFITVIILTAYFLIDEKIYSSFLEKALPAEKNREVRGLFSKISQKVGDWLRGQLILGLIIGVIVYIGLSIIGVKYALILAVIAGILEIVPILGPIISGTLAALVALSVSPVIALITVAFYILLQQFENNILVPKIMNRAIGLPASIIILAVLIGGNLLGIIGALIAVPISSVIFVVLQEWQTIKKILAKND
jgi:predicted PurR-regulated permease PerM